jgi:hypothetical protein
MAAALRRAEPTAALTAFPDADCWQTSDALTHLRRYLDACAARGYALDGSR